MSKCAFCLPAVEYLGHFLSEFGISVEQTKVDAIKTWMVPRCKTDVQSFLGMVNFYSRFIMNCARISRRLTQLTGNTPFTWDEKTQEAFERLKKALCTAPVLRTFDPQLPIVVTTDASGFAIGAVLEQDEDGFRRPVAYFSRTMNPHEQNYHAQEQELFAIVESLRHWRSYLHGQKFLGQTDHASLQYLTTQDLLTPAYHPETDGQTEVVDRKVEETLRCFVNHNQSNWDLFLIDLEFAYNSAPHSSTTLSPFFLTYGTEPRGASFGMTTNSNPQLPILLKTFIPRSQRHTKPSFAQTNTQPFKPIDVADHPPSPLAILSWFLPELYVLIRTQAPAKSCRSSAVLSPLRKRSMMSPIA
jgi:RNase H-like domain found in reverse transcriptase